MYDTTPPTVPIRTRDANIKRFLWGAAPLAAATIAALWQLLDPYASPGHLWLLGSTLAILGCTTLADWVWCAIRDIKQRLIEKELREEARYRKIMERIDTACANLREHDEAMNASIARLERCTKGIHGRLEKQTTIIAGQQEEIVHLRALILGSDGAELALPQQGPRLVR